MADQELLLQYFSGVIFSFFSRRETNLEGAKSEEKEAMAKQVKVSLKFEIEEVCLSNFHSSNLLILPMGLNFLKVYSRRKIMRAIFDCVKSNTQWRI